MTFCWPLHIALHGYINYSHIYILKHWIVVPFQYVYSQLHLFRTSANVPINRHPSFHFKKFVFSFIHKRLQREREREIVLFVVHGDYSASSTCCSSFYLGQFYVNYSVFIWFVSFTLFLLYIHTQICTYIVYWLHKLMSYICFKTPNNRDFLFFH